MVDLFRLPAGRPVGLPLDPFLNCPFVLLVEFFIHLMHSTGKSIGIGDFSGKGKNFL
jgi:hypothetical protein